MSSVITASGKVENVSPQALFNPSIQGMDVLTPFSRSRKFSGSAVMGRILSLSTPSAVPSMNFSNEATTMFNDGGNRRRSSSLVSTRMGSRRQSQQPGISQEAPVAVMSKRRSTLSRQTSSGNSTVEVKHLPTLNESRAMNLTDIMIWKKFTRNLRQRVVDRKNEKRTFCWLDRSFSTRENRRSLMPAAEVEPTYRTEPEEKPSLPKYKSLVEDYLHEKLVNVKYEDPETAATLSRSISDEVKEKIKSNGWVRRYRCIVYVTLGQKMEQGVQVSSLCAWDSKHDSYISCTFQNSSLFCAVTVFAVYME